MVSAREASFYALSKIERDHSYSNLVLSDMIKDFDLTQMDFSLAHRIVKTVLERKITADYNLSLYLTQPLKKVKPQVLTILRMGACQILFMDKIPLSAAVNESVKLAKKCGCGYAAGLVNAVLRQVAVHGLQLPEDTDDIRYLSIKYSFPEFFCEKFTDYYGREIAEDIMASSLDSSPVYVRKNNLKSGILSFDYEQCSVVDNCFIRKHNDDITNDKDFIRGLFHVQDLSSQLCCAILSPKSGDIVLDICASPGGKTATMAEMMDNTGKIIACDIHDHRLKLISDTMLRLGIDIVDICNRDGTDRDAPLPMADKILCDVPCSGLGVTSKKPEIKYKSYDEIKDLPRLQLDILENSSRFLKEGGRIMYSTCTLLPEENISVCREFLQKNPNFVPVAPDSGIEGFRDGDTLTILPGIYNCDGFFSALFERRT